MSTTPKIQADLYAELERHLPLGPEWKQGDNQRVQEFELLTYKVDKPEDCLAEIIDRLHFLERTRYPEAEFVLLVTDYSDAEFTIFPVRLKK